MIISLYMAATKSKIATCIFNIKVMVTKAIDLDVIWKDFIS